MHVPAWPVLPDSTLAPDAVLEKFRVRSLAGFGTFVCPDPSNPDTCYDDGTPAGGGGGSPTPTSSVNLCSLYPDATGCGAPTSSVPMPISALPSTMVGNQTGYVIPSQSSAQWANAIAALAKSGMTLAEIQSIQPGTVVSANGAILRQAPGYAVPAGLGTGILPASTMSGSSLLLFAGVGLLAVMMMSQGRR